jgi:hypothetical protein
VKEILNPAILKSSLGPFVQKSQVFANHSCGDTSPIPFDQNKIKTLDNTSPNHKLPDLIVG